MSIQQLIEAMDQPLAAVDVERAVEILDEKGWIKEALVSSGGYCALGAVCAARAERLLSAHDYLVTLTGEDRALLLNMGKEPGYGHLTLTVFNDAPGTTKEQVQERLTLVAKQLRDMGR